VTQGEALAILADTTKRIDGDIVWRQHPDITYSVSFRVEVVCSVDRNIVLAGYYNRENKKFYLTLFRRSDGKPFFRLCMESGHHNPSCTQAGDPHLHHWDDEEGDKIAEAATFSTDGGVRDIWREFCRAANIIHNGILQSPTPLQKEMY
jgi:hypothetical protein